MFTAPRMTATDKLRATLVGVLGAFADIALETGRFSVDPGTFKFGVAALRKQASGAILAADMAFEALQLPVNLGALRGAMIRFANALGAGWYSPLAAPAVSDVAAALRGAVASMGTGGTQNPSLPPSPGLQSVVQVLGVRWGGIASSLGMLGMLPPLYEGLDDAFARAADATLLRPISAVNAQAAADAFSELSVKLERAVAWARDSISTPSRREFMVRILQNALQDTRQAFDYYNDMSERESERELQRGMDLQIQRELEATQSPIGWGGGGSLPPGTAPW